MFGTYAMHIDFSGKDIDTSTYEIYLFLSVDS